MSDSSIKYSGELNDYIGYNLNKYIQVHTTGCILCISDALKFAGKLNQMEKAIVFNTCSFIANREIENKTLLNILRKAYPDYKLYILGCDVDYQKDYYAKIGDVVLTNDEVRNIIKGDYEYKPVKDNTRDQTIYIKIQDGCYYDCTYCIIHKLRGKPFSIPYDEILSTIKRQIKETNCTNIVLGATEFTNYYDTKYDFTITKMLQQLIKDCPEITSISFSEFDPGHKETENMIKLIGKYPDIFNHHLILGVQSASNTILKRMKRRHTVERLKYLHNLAEEYKVTLLWELIVGFPGETDELFMETYNNMKELHAIVHNLFKYSPRKGTPAAEYKNQISEEIKDKRITRIQNLCNDENIKYEHHHIDYNKFRKEEEVIKLQKSLKLGALDLLQKEEAEELTLDIFNVDDIVEFIKRNPNNQIVHVNYDINRKTQSDITIDFLSHFFEHLIIIIHVPKDFKDEKLLLSRHINCITKKDL